jgi:hypothetical protein
VVSGEDSVTAKEVNEKQEAADENLNCNLFIGGPPIFRSSLHVDTEA